MILAPVMNLMNSKASNYLSKAKGSYFLAAQFAGMLRCSLYGDVSQITVFKLDLSEISVRNQNGSRILEFPNKCHFCRSIVKKIWEQHSANAYLV